MAEPSATATAPRARVRTARRAVRGTGLVELSRDADFSVPLQIALTSAPILVADLVALALPLTLLSGAAETLGAPQTNAWAWLAVSAVLVFVLTGLYPPLGLNPVREVARLCRAAGWVFVGLLVHDVGAGTFDGDRLAVLVLGWALAVPALVWLRSVARSLCARSEWWGLRAVVVGEPRLTATIVRDLGANGQIGLVPVAQMRELPTTPPQLHQRPRCHPELVRQRAAFAVFALAADDAEGVQHTIKQHFTCVPNLLVVGATGTREAHARVVNCRGLSGLLVQPWLLRRTSHSVRRALSLAVALPITLAILPVFALLAALVKLSSPGPTFFAQERIGAHRKKIRVWKFRTMVSDADLVLEEHLTRHPELRSEWERLHKLTNDPRVTRIGRLLRKTSLDELPQLLNVIKGDMCLVGPRPIVDAEIPKYGTTFDTYLQVAPGLTGLWQVSGRNHTSYDKRVRLDHFYVRNWSLWLDLWVLARTLTVVCMRQGAH